MRSRIPKRFHPIAIPTISAQRKIGSLPKNCWSEQERTNRNHVCVERGVSSSFSESEKGRRTKRDALIVRRRESRSALDARSSGSADRRSGGWVGILRLCLGRGRNLDDRGLVARGCWIEGDREVRRTEDGDGVGALVLGDGGRSAIDAVRRFAKGRKKGDCFRNVVGSSDEQQMSSALEQDPEKGTNAVTK